MKRRNRQVQMLRPIVAGTLVAPAGAGGLLLYEGVASAGYGARAQDPATVLDGPAVLTLAPHYDGMS